MNTSQVKIKAPKHPVEEQDVVHTTLKDAEAEVTISEDIQTDKEDKTSSSNSDTPDFWTGEREDDYHHYLK